MIKWSHNKTLTRKITSIYHSCGYKLLVSPKEWRTMDAKKNSLDKGNNEVIIYGNLSHLWTSVVTVNWSYDTTFTVQWLHIKWRVRKPFKKGLDWVATQEDEQMIGLPVTWQCMENVKRYLSLSKDNPRPCYRGPSNSSETIPRQERQQTTQPATQVSRDQALTPVMFRGNIWRNPST